jgi:hypothetical protein
MTSTLSARELGRQAIIDSLPNADWATNSAFAGMLCEQVHKHRIMTHPIMHALAGGKVDYEQMRLIHLEFFHAFAQVFTDAVINTMFTASQLEQRLNLGAKAAARFLLQFNLLEELGFKPGMDHDGSFKGNLQLAHYLQFGETLKQLGITDDHLKHYAASPSATACRATFEGSYGDHVKMTALLAVSETVFHDYANIWSTGVAKSTNIDVSQGYHSIHVENESGDSIEDGHSEEAWLLFTQAVSTDRYEEMKMLVNHWLSIWTQFLDQIVASCNASTPDIAKEV